MSKRTMGLIFIIAGLAAIGAIIFFLFLSRDGSQTAEESGNLQNSGSLEASDKTASTGNPAAGNDESAEFSLPANQVVPADLQKNTAERIAALFAERFGSFSSQSGFANMDDLDLYMTESMKAWARQYVAEARAKSAGLEEYSGISTKAINAIAEKFEQDKSGIFIVKTQRTETSAAGKEPKVYIQDLKIELVKAGKDWKADRAEWLEVK